MDWFDFNTGDHMDRFELIEVSTWTGLTNRGDNMERFDLIEVTTLTGFT